MHTYRKFSILQFVFILIGVTVVLFKFGWGTTTTVQAADNTASQTVTPLVVDTAAGVNALITTGEAPRTSQLLGDNYPAWVTPLLENAVCIKTHTDRTDLGIYAVRTNSSVIVLLRNNTESSMLVRLRTQLSRGVYSGDSAVFNLTSPDSGIIDSQIVPAVLPSSRALIQNTTLPSGAVAIIRFINRCEQAYIANRNLKTCLNVIKQSSPGVWRKMMAPLRECEDNISTFSAIRTDNRYKQLRYVHRALLTLGQALSICRNMRGQGAIGGDSARGLEKSLVDLDFALTQISMGCLELVPEMTLTPPSPSGEQSLTVSLKNNGMHTVQNVRISAVVPPDCLTKPAQEAFFDTLGPGQTARAAYSLRDKAGAPIYNISCNFAYFAERSPAHISLQPVSSHQ